MTFGVTFWYDYVSCRSFSVSQHNNFVFMVWLSWFIYENLNFPGHMLLSKYTGNLSLWVYLLGIHWFQFYFMSAYWQYNECIWYTDNASCCVHLRRRPCLRHQRTGTSDLGFIKKNFKLIISSNPEFFLQFQVIWLIRT